MVVMNLLWLLVMVMLSVGMTIVAVLVVMIVVMSIPMMVMHFMGNAFAHFLKDWIGARLLRSVLDYLEGTIHFPPEIMAFKILLEHSNTPVYANPSFSFVFYF